MELQQSSTKTNSKNSQVSSSSQNTSNWPPLITETMTKVVSRKVTRQCPTSLSPVSTPWQTLPLTVKSRRSSSRTKNPSKSSQNVKVSSQTQWELTPDPAKGQNSLKITAHHTPKTMAQQPKANIAVLSSTAPKLV